LSITPASLALSLFSDVRQQPMTMLIRIELACLALIMACTSERPAPPNAAAAQTTDSSVRMSARSEDTSLVGDTLELVGIGNQMVPRWDGVPIPCDSAHTPLIERIIFTDDSSYFAYTVDRPGCRDERFASSDTSETTSSYAIRGDTLAIYSGGGNETFQWYNGRLYADSVVQLFIEPEQARRYSRRRGETRRSH
jgi:hypothetical protein